MSTYKQQKSVAEHSQNMSLADTVAVDVAFRRAEWIGYGVLWPRSMLHNAGAWGPQKNREYQAAFDAQKSDIEEALAHETPEMKCRRMESCAVSAPDPADGAFDAYLAIAEMQSKVFFQKGIIMALEMTRQCNDSHLVQSKQEFAVLKRKHEIMLEEFWTMYPQHLERNNMRIFMRDDTQISRMELRIRRDDDLNVLCEVGCAIDAGFAISDKERGLLTDAVDCDDASLGGDGMDGVLGKRRMSDTKSQVHAIAPTTSRMLRHNSEYWLAVNRLNVGIAILSSE
jgi:hypothetical protein